MESFASLAIFVFKSNLEVVSDSFLRAGTIPTSGSGEATLFDSLPMVASTFRSGEVTRENQKTPATWSRVS